MQTCTSTFAHFHNQKVFAKILIDIKKFPHSRHIDYNFKTLLTIRHQTISKKLIKNVEYF